MSPAAPHRIPVGEFRSEWFWALSFAALITTILVLTGVDSFIEEMVEESTWREAVGITYFAFVLPYYLSIVGAVGLLFWARDHGQILLPHRSRLFHGCNAMFLFPLAVIGLAFVPSIIGWAFGDSPSIADVIVIVVFLLVFRYWAVKRIWWFVKWTWSGIFAPHHFQSQPSIPNA